MSFVNAQLGQGVYLEGTDKRVLVRHDIIDQYRAFPSLAEANAFASKFKQQLQLRGNPSRPTGGTAYDYVIARQKATDALMAAAGEGPAPTVSGLGFTVTNAGQVTIVDPGAAFGAYGAPPPAVVAAQPAAHPSIAIAGNPAPRRAGRVAAVGLAAAALLGVLLRRRR